MRNLFPLAFLSAILIFRAAPKQTQRLQHANTEKDGDITWTAQEKCQSILIHHKKSSLKTHKRVKG